jgi:hypothetical protein
MHWTRCAIDEMPGLTDQTSAVDAKKGGTTSWKLVDHRDKMLALTTGISCAHASSAKAMFGGE